ncbi:MAG TPA: glutamate--tRNA ligase [Verrucomicrobiae bacterium]|nr:glutamate--tRNA ligase [Verrucomicrobiae bacterium]
MTNPAPSGGPRVRFAPSPTGFLHVGGGRTALFNWLYARARKGTFILRIEDTDLERSNEASVRTILEGLTWLGLDWDEGPFFQSRGLEEHRALAHRLEAEGKAYPCFCTVEEIEPRRRAAEAAGGAWRYDRNCLRLSAAEREERRGRGLTSALRFRVPEGMTAWNDQVHGETSFDNGVIEDLVLLRSDGSPTYNLSVVADDIAMRVTDVIRGDDHISNTPKQILLYRALGHEPPAFAHLPLILGSDKKRLSKRHGAVSVTEYRDTGILPAAMRNFLALLGWSPGDGREVMTREELVAAFDIAAVNRKGAVFDEQKLEWLNSEYIQKLPGEALYDVAQPYLEAAGLLGPDLAPGGARRDWFLRVLETLKARSRRLTDFPRDAKPFLGEDYPIDPPAAAKYLTAEKSGGAKQVAARLRALAAAVAALQPFDEAASEAALRELATSKGEAAALYIHPMRVALLGTAVGPSAFAVLVLIGQERAVQRLTRLAGRLDAGEFTAA